MFTPSQADVRRFFCAVYAKTQAGQPLEALETIASQWLAEHPEYHGDFADSDAALNKMYDIKDGKTNPFLHLSMHLSISEQCSIDQPAKWCGKASAPVSRLMARRILTAYNAARHEIDI